MKPAIGSQQLQAIEIIADQLEGRAYFIDTVFDPWQTLQRHLAGAGIEHLMTEAPEALMKALDVITDASSPIAAGLFVSVRPAFSCRFRRPPRSLRMTAFLKFVLPYTRRLFAAISGRGFMNTAHIHGKDLYFGDVLDLPAAIFSWWDRSAQRAVAQIDQGSNPGVVSWAASIRPSSVVPARDF